MEFSLLLVAMMLAGIAGGLLAGLLGVGGGIVIVPVLDVTFAALGVDETYRVHMAVATSLATIIPTSISSARAHHRRGAVDLEVLRRWLVWIAVGALLGIAISAVVSGAALAGVFAVVAFVAAVNMMLPFEGRKLGKELPAGLAGVPVPIGIGLVSTLMGIGGGTMTVPVLTLFNKPVHIAVGTSSILGLVIAVPATLGYVITGWRLEGLPPGSIGYVNLVGLGLIAPMTVLCAPLGARIAHSLSRRALGVAFGVFLMMAAIRMGSTAI